MVNQFKQDGQVRIMDPIHVINVNVRNRVLHVQKWPALLNLLIELTQTKHL